MRVDDNIVLPASSPGVPAYQESMPSACFIGSSGTYVQKHDPWIYYNDIRTNTARCAAHVVPYTQFGPDMSSGNVANFDPNDASTWEIVGSDWGGEMHINSDVASDAAFAQETRRHSVSPAEHAQTARSMLPWQWLQATIAVLDIRTIVECSPQFGHTEVSSNRCRQYTQR